MRASEEGYEDERGLLNNKWQEAHMSEGKQGAWKTWAIPTICLFLGAFLGTIFSGAMTRAKAKDAQVEPAHASNSSHDISSIFPSNTHVVFDRNVTFGNYSASDAEKVWEALEPLGRGFIRIDAHGHPIPHVDYPAHPPQTKVVAAFHQIHCLNLLRKSLDASINDAISFRYLVPQLSSLWSHCFDYLRQALMCSADVTLEEVKADGSELLTSVDGWGAEHVCRDYEALKEWTEKYRASDDGGTD